MTRYYKLNGKDLPSVTTICGVLDKPALVQWAANQACEYRELLKAKEGDLNAIQEDVKRLSHRNRILWGYLQKYNQKRSAA